MYQLYLLSLGEFAMGGFEDHPEMTLVYFFFTMATFFTQIIFLNMLIAIMGDTFGRVIENKANYGMQTKLSIMGDYTAVIDQKNTLRARCCGSKNASDEGTDKLNYLFVVKPKSDGDDENQQAWEGGLGLIKKSVDHSMSVMNKNLSKSIEKVTVQNLEAKTRDTTLDKEVRNQYQRISTRFQDLENRQEVESKRQQDQIMRTMNFNRRQQ